MKIIGPPEIVALVNRYQAVFKLIEEKKRDIDIDPFWTPADLSMGLGGSLKPTGKYHFLMYVDAPDTLTGLDQSGRIITQKWELTEEIEHENDYYLQFESWGEPPLMKYEGAELFIKTVAFIPIFIKLNELNSEVFSADKLKNTIGLERLSI